MTKLNLILASAAFVAMTFAVSAPANAHGSHSFKSVEEQLAHMRAHDGSKLPNTDFDEKDLEDDRDFDLNDAKRDLKEMRDHRGRPLPNTGMDDDIYDDGI